MDVCIVGDDTTLILCIFLYQVLATCSFDRTASIWEEVAGGGGPSAVATAAAGTEPGELGHWVRRTSLVDSSEYIAVWKAHISLISFIPDTLCSFRDLGHGCQIFTEAHGTGGGDLLGRRHGANL